MPNDSGAQSPALYDSIKATPSKRLTNGVEKVEGITPEEEQALERGGELALRGAKRRVLRWCWYLGFGCIALLALAGCVALIAMVSIYIYAITESGKLGDVIGAILQFVFGGAAVLSTEFLVKKATNKVKD